MKTRLHTLDLKVNEADILWKYRVKISGADDFEEELPTKERELALDDQ